MHQRIREADPDYADVELGIIQFDSDGDEPHARIHLATSQDLFTFDDLNMMVQQTYAIWQEVRQERESAARRTGTDGKFFEF